MDTRPPTRLTRQPWPLAYSTPPLGALPTAPRVAREAIRSTLPLWRLQAKADVAATIGSELTTNAVNASTRDERPAYDESGRLLTVGMVLRSDGERLRIEVWDRADGQPVRTSPGAWDTSGRGLGMVDYWTRRNWGWTPHDPLGWKLVFAELSHPIPDPLEEASA